MEEPFRKDLTHLSWDEVYARQAKRAHLVGEWMDALRLKAGDRVLDLALLWQFHSSDWRNHLRQWGHRSGGCGARAAMMARRTAGSVG